MAVTPDLLKSLARKVDLLAIDIYDKEDASSPLDFLATRIPNPLKRSSGDLEWAMALPQLRLWIGERVTDKAFSGNMSWVSRPVHVTLEYDVRKAETEEGLVTLQKMSTSIAQSFAHGKVQMVMDVLRENMLAYDNQDMFDTDHVHPDGTSYSNVFDLDRADEANPDISEARDEFLTAEFLLAENRLLRNQIALSKDGSKDIIVIVKSRGSFLAYEALRKEEKIGGDPNSLRGTFTLVRDRYPKAGTENSVDFVLSEPNGPRPAFFIETANPTGVDFDYSKVFGHKLVPFGMDGDYGFRGGFPQTCCRAQ